MTNQPDKKNDTNVAYGTLYMDGGEKLDKAEEQITKISLKKPFMWFFDIICTPNQIPTAKEHAVKLSYQIEDLNPDMKPVAIVVGVTTKDGERPAQTLLQRISQQYKGNKLQGMKLDDGRHFIWVGGEPRNG